FTKQTPIDSPDDSLLSESANNVFLGFTYIAPSVLEEMHKPFAAKTRNHSPRKINSPEILNQMKSLPKQLFPNSSNNTTGRYGVPITADEHMDCSNTYSTNNNISRSHVYPMKTPNRSPSLPVKNSIKKYQL
ncbi:unnamed protein product, partial [Medioppia subpectinata]